MQKRFSRPDDVQTRKTKHVRKNALDLDARGVPELLWPLYGLSLFTRRCRLISLCSINKTGSYQTGRQAQISIHKRI